VDLEIIDRKIKTGPYAHMTVKEKFFSMPKTYLASTGCLVWDSKKFSNGYGNFRAFGKEYLAHRVAFLLAKQQKVRQCLQIR